MTLGPQHEETDHTPPTEAHPIPSELPILPLHDIIVYPQTAVPLQITESQSVQTVDEALVGDRLVLAVAYREGAADANPPTADQLYDVGTVAMVQRFLKLPDGTLRVLVQGLERVKIVRITRETPNLRAEVEPLADTVETGVEVDALVRNLQALVGQMAQLVPQFPEELQTIVLNENDPQRLVNLLSITTRLEMPERQALLEETNVRRRMERLNSILTRELEVLRVGQQIQGQVNEEVGKGQREYILRQQMRAIQKELGESDENEAQTTRLREAIEAAHMPPEAHEQAVRELDRLIQMNPAAADYGMTRTYLEALIDIPWDKHTDDQLDVSVARTVLDEDHYDLQEIKERILEFLAVRELRRQRLGNERSGTDAAEGAILCFVGPPGVGKTSLGRSIARAMNRKFLRIALGGVRDEAEIRGHRRTYIGAMPGSIIQSLRRIGVNNPLFMLDEIDKMGSDYRGDPSSAMLEVLDPEQNATFRDHYLDVPFDLSNTVFIATANTLSTIPPPLRDRMEIIELSGYTARQKLEIGRRYLLPEQLRRHALSTEDVIVEDSALLAIIEEYTREAGVRNLEREIGRICRKVAVTVAQNAETPRPIRVDAALAHLYLGKQHFFPEVSERTDRPGIVTGLVYTPVGGDIIFIEATKMPGGRGFQLTGQLGDVMKESARAALSYIRAESEQIGIPPTFFNGIDIHLHVPAGAIPKDGPSAGIAMATALVSLLTGRPVKPDLAMTGEITLRGKVLPIGGLKEKVLAAHRAGIRTIILPHRNEADLDDIPADVRAEITFIPVERVDQVLAAALRERPVEAPVQAGPELSPLLTATGEGIHIMDDATPVSDNQPVMGGDGN
ncbi:MAG: endopeptidase La [Herpetosiphon sp.]